MQGKGRGDSRLPLKPLVYPNPAFLCPNVSRVRRLYLHSTLLAPGEVSLCWVAYPIKRVEILKVATEHPSIPKLTRALRHRARDPAIALGLHLISHARSWLKVILQHYQHLVGVMLLCQMSAEGACLHQRIAMATYNHPTFPLPSQSHPPPESGHKSSLVIECVSSQVYISLPASSVHWS